MIHFHFMAATCLPCKIPWKKKNNFSVLVACGSPWFLYNLLFKSLVLSVELWCVKSTLILNIGCCPRWPETSRNGSSSPHIYIQPTSRQLYLLVKKWETSTEWTLVHTMPAWLHITGNKARGILLDVRYRISFSLYFTCALHIIHYLHYTVETKYIIYTMI